MNSSRHLYSQSVVSRFDEKYLQLSRTASNKKKSERVKIEKGGNINLEKWSACEMEATGYGALSKTL